MHKTCTLPLPTPLATGRSMKQIWPEVLSHPFKAVFHTSLSYVMYTVRNLSDSTHYVSRWGTGGLIPSLLKVGAYHIVCLPHFTEL